MKSVLLGFNQNESIYLRSPNWDCSWYVGFGYIGNNNFHSHLDSFLDDQAPNKNMFDQMKDVFGDTLNEILKDEKNLWRFCDLFKSWLTLKQAYELYNRGSSHYCTIEDPNIKRLRVATLILKDLFSIVNAICDLLGLEKLEWSEQIQRDVYNNMFPTTFTQRKPTESDKREWTLVYLNKYDDPKNHKDKVLPKEVKAKWLKIQKLEEDHLSHVKFQNLFKEVKA